MKRYRIIIIGAITLLIAIFIGFTVRINMIFPNAKDVTYTSDNPPIIDGLKITPVDYDPGASETNQTNRIKLLMTVAKDNLELQEKEKIALENENKEVSKTNINN